MLAGYLPFDDDPANPEGDNINLLYKYIVSTPLTFPEYVTPHARDILKRILVPDPRKRADLFEVARHSWLSDYAHVVAHITSSTTNIDDIANAAPPSGKSWSGLSRYGVQTANISSEDRQEQPSLARSASVREPTKTRQANLSPVGGLVHQQGNVAPEQEEKKTSRDNKRRTVQVEYVAPQSQTARGEGPSTATSPSTTSPVVPSQGRTKAREPGPIEVAQIPDRTKPLPLDPSVQDRQAYADPSRNARPGSSSRGMQPPTRPARDVPRSVSDSTGAFGMGQTPPLPRPGTGGSMTATRSDVRLPSRGSYSQPLAPKVDTENVQGRVTQPKNGKQYVVATPPLHGQTVAQDYVNRPSTQQYSQKPEQILGAEQPVRGHKRSNTVGGIGERIWGRSSSLFGGGKPPQAAKAPKQAKRYPPTSMKEPIGSDSPRLSTDSKRSTSFGFGRKRSDLESGPGGSGQERPRRFSLLPASFSFKSLAGKDQAEPETSQFPQPPSSRGYQRPQQSAGNASRGNPGYGSEGAFDVQNRAPPQRDLQQQFDNYNATQQYPPADRSYLVSETPPVENWDRTQQKSYPQQPQQQQRPLYPAGFNSYDSNPSQQQQQQQQFQQQPQSYEPNKANVLQKNNRKFRDAYEGDHDPAYGGNHGHGGGHSGSSGAARKVMDFFRRRGRARTDN